MQHRAGSLSPGNFLLALPVESRFVTIQCGHNGLLPLGLVDEALRRHNLGGGATIVVDSLRIIGEAANSARLAMSTIEMS